MSLTPTHYVIENSWLGLWDARWRLIGFMLALIAFASLGQLAPGATALGIVALVTLSTRVSWQWLWVRLLVVGIGLIPFLLFTPFVVATGETLWEWWYFKWTDQGVRVSLHQGLKVLTVTMLGFLLFAAAPFSIHLAAARRLGMPRVLVAIMGIAYRYIFLLLDELNRLRVSLRTRGFRNGLTVHALQTVARVAGALLVRGSDRAERVAQAMRVRGFQGNMPIMTEFRTTRRDVLYWLVALGLSLALVLWDRLA